MVQGIYLRGGYFDYATKKGYIIHFVREEVASGGEDGVIRSL